MGKDITNVQHWWTLQISIGWWQYLWFFYLWTAIDWRQSYPVIFCDDNFSAHRKMKKFNHALRYCLYWGDQVQVCWFRFSSFDNFSEGKGTQAELLASEFGLKHVSVGELLREEMRSGSKQSKLIHDVLSKGHIVPAEISVRLLKNHIIQQQYKHYIVDG